MNFDLMIFGFFLIFLVLKFMGLFSRFDICGWFDFSLFM